MGILIAKVGRSGAGGANADYITRLNGAEKIAFHNLDHLESNDLSEARTNAIAYAHAREEIELAKGKKAGPKNKESSDQAIEQKAGTNRQSGNGESQMSGEKSIEPTKNKNVKERNKHTKEKQIRTHYRLIASWKGKETSEKAIEEAKIYLQEQFPKARAIIAIHQDTADTHAHIWIDARQTDGKKIHLKEKVFETLDEKWTEQYDRTYGTNFAPEYKALKVETKEWKKKMYEWRKAKREKAEGAELAPEPIKPQRAADRFKTDYWREKEVQELVGVKRNEKINTGTDYSDAQGRNRFAETGDRFAQKTKFPSAGKEYASGAGEQADSRAKSNFSGAAQDGEKLITADRNDYQASEDGRTGFAENQRILQFDDEQNNVPFPRFGSLADAFTSTQISEEQFHQAGYEFNPNDGISSLGYEQRDFRQDSTIGKFNLELIPMPEVQYQVPQLQMDDKIIINNTVELVTNSLERQREEMNEFALSLYKEHLNYIAELPPSPNLIQKINQFNQESSKDDFIETENKSWLEANHEYLSSMSAQRLDKEAVSIAEEFEEDLEDRIKWDPDYREQEGIQII